jgi:hypothetical protein
MSAKRCSESLKVCQPFPVREHYSFAIGLADVERAYVHVDYEDEHDIKEEHKPLYEVTQKRSIKEKAKALFYLFQKKDAPA